MTADSKVFVALLAILQVAGIMLFFAAKVRMSFAASAAAALLILLVVSSSWSRIGGGEILFLVGEGSLLLAAIYGAIGRVPVTGWWVVWTANLLMLAFLVYGAFFFHVFQ